MSSQRRRGSSALVAAALALVCLSSVLNFEVAQAETYTVGDSEGWSEGCVSWTRGKQFKAGDIIVFKYDAEMKDVVVVNRAGYNNCTAPANAITYHTGHDRIILHKGHNLFICNLFSDHCKSGMKLDVKAM